MVNIQKGTIQRNRGLGAPQTLRRLRRTQGPFNGKLMGMFGIKGETEGGGGGSLVVWELNSKGDGLGGGSPLMQNGLGCGGAAGDCGEEGREVERIPW